MTRANIAILSLSASVIALLGVLHLSKVNVERIADAGLSLFFISTANATVGHPLTPVSYAGVARRTARRNN